MVTKFGTGFDLHDFLDEFEDQGHRSKSPGQKTLFPRFSHLNNQIENPGLCCNIMMTFDIMVWHHGVTSKLNNSQKRKLA